MSHKTSHGWPRCEVEGHQLLCKTHPSAVSDPVDVESCCTPPNAGEE